MESERKLAPVVQFSGPGFGFGVEAKLGPESFCRTLRGPIAPFQGRGF